MTIARPTSTATTPQKIETAAAPSVGSGIATPISRKAAPVSTKARNSHTTSIASWARGLMPFCRPYEPTTIPATTLAMIPDACPRSATR